MVSPETPETATVSGVGIPKGKKEPQGERGMFSVPTVSRFFFSPYFFLCVFFVCGAPRHADTLSTARWPTRAAHIARRAANR
jgi:hypothetical protein